MFAMWTSTTVPVSVRGSMEALSRCSARTGGYSTPWVPAMSASTGPGLEPWMTVKGMIVPSSPGRRGTVSVARRERAGRGRHPAHDEGCLRLSGTRGGQQEDQRDRPEYIVACGGTSCDPFFVSFP